MPIEQTALSEDERCAIDRVAQERGLTFDEVVEQLAKEGLASRVRRKTGRAPARVYVLRPRQQAAGER